MSTAEALATSPDTLCVGASNGGHDYWFCPGLRTWQDARSKCQAVSYDLAQVETSAENQFLQSHSLTNSWLAGSDATVEGAWRWAGSNAQFWQGAGNGAAVGGAFTNWRSGQPDNLLNQDCLQLQPGLGQGNWTDEICSLPASFICEGDLCPSDPAKTEPGQCGCGMPDTDSDADGTADCKDTCPNDKNKVALGVCGCGNPDKDSDNDGTLDCNDQCPNDSKHVVSGDCRCSNAPKPSGTACDDGLCPANNQCDGAGSCGTPAQCGTPDSSCSFQRRGTQLYWFCDNSRSFSDARARCQSVGMDLAIADNSAENDYLRTTAHGASFLGGSDQTTEGEWFWLKTGVKFWTGGQNGQSVAGAYTNWDSLQPSNLLSTNDCLLMNTILLPGKWQAVSCTSTQRYVCELTDLCPSDPNKLEPGVCGCGVADTDSDGDGTKDCVDSCPQDASKSAVGQYGCGNPDTDSDGDGVADCRDACDGGPDTDSDHDGVADCIDQCPSDPDRTVPGNCGCVGNAGPAAAGTPCFDGLCQANTQCDGAGSCGSANQCTPSGANCTPISRNGHLYLFCTNASSWNAAQAFCHEQPDMELVRIDDADENDFVRSHLTGDAWLGSSDVSSPDQWSWALPTPSKGKTFWSGTQSGTAAGYVNWSANQPDGGDCLSMSSGTGLWSDASCSNSQNYVCEVYRPAGIFTPRLLSIALNKIGDGTQRARTAFGLFAAQRALCNVANGSIAGDTELWISNYISSKLSPADMPAATAMLQTMCSHPMPAALRKTYLGALASADPLDDTIYAAGSSLDSCDSATATTDHPARLRSNYCSHGVNSDSRALTVESVRTDCFVCQDDDLRATFYSTRFDAQGRMDVDTVDYDHDFDEGDVRNEDATVSQVRMRRDSTAHWELVYTEFDSFVLETVLLSAGLSALGTYVLGPYGAALGAFGNLPEMWSDFVEKPDIMGADAWEADISRLNEAYGDSRTADLLASNTMRHPIASLPHADPSKINRKWTNACDHLMHPFDRS